MSITRSIGYLAVLAAPAAAFWRLPCKSPLVVERVDPIVAPGNVSAHVHTVMGGNGFDFEMDYADTQASTCTSCTVHGDFSNYWTPVLYYQGEDGTFTKVDQVGGATVYYLQRGGPNNDKLEAFPEGFRMISGDPFKRSGGDDFASQAISYNCLGTTNPETGAFPNYNCPDGLRSQVFFPSCWDGVNNDSANHKSHMAFPIDAYNNGKCPDSHPVHLVSIFYEIIWDTNKFADKWYGGKQPFVWAMGDPTGYGFHGDFVMGWDKNILQKAVDECTNDSGRVEDCPVFQLYPDSTAEGCKIAPKVNEDVQGPMQKLLGCNPVQEGPGEAQIIKNCGDNATIGTGKSFFKDLTSEGWGYQGCGTDNYYARALTGASTSQAGMTNEQCIKFCGDKGFSVAGTEYSKECYCANSIPASAQPVAGVVGNCNMACDGDTTEYCGGSGLLTLYQKCTGSSCSNAGGMSGSSSPVSSTASILSPSSVTQQSNAQVTTSLLGRGTTSAISFPSASSSSEAGSPVLVSSSAAYTAPADASAPGASGSASAIVSSLPSFSATANLPPGWKYQGCFTDTVNPRTLPKLAPYTMNNTFVTSTNCVSYCSSKGYNFAGTEYGGECWCGNSAPTQSLEASKCAVACKGDSSQICGGWAALSLYSLSSNNKRDEVGSVVRDHMKRHGQARYARSVFS